jgi:hypothetical protein
MGSVIISTSIARKIFLRASTKPPKNELPSKLSISGTKKPILHSKINLDSKFKPLKNLNTPTSYEVSMFSQLSTTATSSQNFVKAGICRIESKLEVSSRKPKLW